MEQSPAARQGHGPDVGGKSALKKKEEKKKLHYDGEMKDEDSVEEVWHAE